MRGYYYDGVNHRLVIRMPTDVHGMYIARVEDAMFSQLKLIREGDILLGLYVAAKNPP